MATVDKTESCKKQSVAQRLECDYMELVKYQSLSKVYLLNDDTYRWNCATSSYGQIE